jgi:DNA-3-methyladenine glycosylase
MAEYTALARSFFERKTEVVARELLGKLLIRDGRAFRITETEAYLGPFDLAAHSRFGRTKRTEVMFGPAGSGSAVLIRGAGEITGPGRLCRQLDITRAQNGVDLTVPGQLYVADGKEIAPGKILVTPRIGVDYAKDWKDKPLRFVLR